MGVPLCSGFALEVVDEFFCFRSGFFLSLRLGLLPRLLGLVFRSVEAAVEVLVMCQAESYQSVELDKFGRQSVDLPDIRRSKKGHSKVVKSADSHRRLQQLLVLLDNVLFEGGCHGQEMDNSKSGAGPLF